MHVPFRFKVLTQNGIEFGPLSAGCPRSRSDWPNAYRHPPIGLDEARVCVVCFWRHEWQEPAFQPYAGLLYGLPLAVTSFIRYSRLVEALGRRLVMALVSLYFDDTTIRDWGSSRGTPFADAKRQPMSSASDFLGLSHDVSQALSHGLVRFWPRARFVEKIEAMLSEAESGDCLHPGQASKLYGILNFSNKASMARLVQAANRPSKRGSTRAPPRSPRTYGITFSIQGHHSIQA